ncbi:hypothetical protein BU26DRAFT_519374 [Trematosphaeria pertusa]|uniref:Uncharacterized protein n=1 Tax=Trematosphaeria pertusa TaxID=390896 RepID=A0A6A6IF76_9PLEO|nr:uncharacterized protein BU26DRAFT_519374 [Trematosphaeria pertusa]KAF2249235.1 hypothetical protein BU26DRAFT_519374 [Trematosphaeria pertusa]
MVIADLALPDYQALRLASKQLYTLTLMAFSSSFFSKRKTTLGTPSLIRLRRVSCCKHFAGSVSLLEVKLLNHSDYELLQQIDRVGIYPPPNRFRKTF